MRCCRSDRFFNYSDAAKKDPNFPDFKDKIEDTADRYDSANDGILYTTIVAASACAPLGAVQTYLATNASFSTLLSCLQIVVPIVSGCVIGTCKIVSGKALTNGKELISIGTSNGFFKTAPSFPVTSPTTDTSPLIEDNSDHDMLAIHTDAITHRIFGRI